MTISIVPSNTTIIHSRNQSKSPSQIYLSSLSKGSQRTMENALNTIAKLITTDPIMTHDLVSWHQIRYEHAATIRAFLAEKYAFSTANKMLAALRGTLKSAWKLGMMSADEYQTAISFENIKGERLPAGRYISQQEISQILATCQDNLIGKRDRTIILLLYICGLRRDEIVSLNLQDYLQNEGVLLITGKRNKQRRVPIPSSALGHINAWLDYRGRHAGAFFPSAGNRRSDDNLTGQNIYEMLQKRTKQTGVTKLSPHDFRRTYISNPLDNGIDIVTVQKLAGHASVETTANYDRRGEKAKRSAVDSLSFPEW